MSPEQHVHSARAAGGEVHAVVMQDEEEVELIAHSERRCDLQRQVVGEQNDRHASEVREQVGESEQQVLAAVRDHQAADLVRDGSAIRTDRGYLGPSPVRLLRNIIINARIACVRHLVLPGHPSQPVRPSALQAPLPIERQRAHSEG